MEITYCGVWQRVGDIYSKADPLFADDMQLVYPFCSQMKCECRDGVCPY